MSPRQIVMISTIIPVKSEHFEFLPVIFCHTKICHNIAFKSLRFLTLQGNVATTLINL
jgi:hypothetical protein